MLAVAPQINQLRPVVPDGDRGFAGVYMRADAGAIPPGFLADAQNGRCRKGVFETRKGVAKLGWSNKTDAASSLAIMPYGTVYGRGVFKDPDSLEWTLVAADGFVYHTREGNPSSSIPLPAGVRILGACTLVQAFNKVYLFRGRDLAPLRLTNFDTGFTDILPLWNASTAYTPVIGSAAAQEVAYGPFLAVTSLASVGTLATVVTTNDHGYITGADITLRGANQAEYNGRFNITVVDDRTFTYQFVGSATATATGTVTCSNMATYYKALGSLLTGVAIARATTTATVTKTAHGFSNTQTVVVTGATGADASLYNITAAISNVTANTFDYTMTGTPTGAATGTINVRNASVTVAGQSPDTNPEAWVQLFTILPNGATALYVQNRLLVPTAYNPDTGGYDAKVDYVIATDYQDETHFDFVSQFRINQGGDDSLLDLAKFSDSGTVICFKDKSVWVLSNINFDLSNVTLTNVIPDYGIVAPRAWAVVGSDCYFMAANRGVVSIQQTVTNKLQGVDLPLSDAIQPLIDRIQWRLGSQIRMEWWDSKLYVAVPLDDAKAFGRNIIPEGEVYPNVNWFAYDVTLGQNYRVQFGSANDLQFAFGAGFTPGSPLHTTGGDFVATRTQIQVYGTPQTSVDFNVRAFRSGVNNAILVYDFLNKAWAGRDTGSAIMVSEFFKATAGGRERLFFISADGFINLTEETDFGDQIKSASVNGLSAERITTYALTRGYTQQTAEIKKGRKMAVVLATWNPEYSLSLKYAGANRTTAIVTNRTKDNTQYYKPWNAAPWDSSNVNLDHATPYRQDYSVKVATQFAHNGILLGAGIVLDRFQETREVFKLTGNPSRFTQVELTNTKGRIELRAVELESQYTERRKGVFA